MTLAKVGRYTRIRKNGKRATSKLVTFALLTPLGLTTREAEILFFRLNGYKREKMFHKDLDCISPEAVFLEFGIIYSYEKILIEIKGESLFHIKAFEKELCPHSKQISEKNAVILTTERDESCVVFTTPNRITFRVSSLPERGN